MKTVAGNNSCYSLFSRYYLVMYIGINLIAVKRKAPECL
jgi:hypothetical protein